MSTRKRIYPTFEPGQKVKVKHPVTWFKTPLNGLESDLVLYEPGSEGKVVERRGDQYTVRMDKPARISVIQFHAGSLELA